MRVSDYLGYLRDMSRKIAFRGGFEACLARAASGGTPPLHGAATGTYAGVSQATWLAQVRQRMEKEDNLGVYVGYGLIAGKVMIEGRVREVAGPLIIIPVDMEPEADDGLDLEFEYEDALLNYDLLALLIPGAVEVQDGAVPDKQAVLFTQELLHAIAEAEAYVESTTSTGLPADPTALVRAVYGILAEQLPVLARLTLTEAACPSPAVLKRLAQSEEGQSLNCEYMFLAVRPSEVTTYQALTKLIKQTHGEHGGEGVQNPVLAKLLLSSIEQATTTLNHEKEVRLSICENVVPLIPLSLSEPQKQAVADAWAADISYVQGPPGTGKSHTITAMLLSAVLMGKKVLLVSNKKAALDVVREKVEKLLGAGALSLAVSDSEGRKQQRARIEDLISRADNVRAADDYREVCRRVETLRRQVDFKLAELYGHEDSIEVYLLGARQAEEALVQLCQARDFYLSSYGEADLRSVGLAGKIAVDDALLRTVDGIARSLECARAAGGLLPRVKALKVRALLSFSLHELGAQWLQAEPRQVEAIRRIDAYIKVLRSAHELARREGVVDRKVDEVRKLITAKQREYEAHCGMLAKEQLEMIRLAKAREHLAELQRFKQVFFYRKPSRLKELFASTKVGSALEALPLWAAEIKDLSAVFPFEVGLFDLVVVDEASQVNIAELIPAFYRGTRFCVVGDDRQLGLGAAGLFALNRNFERLAWERHCEGVSYEVAKTRSILVTEHSILDLVLRSPYAPQLPQVMLDEHFRSRPALAAFTSAEFYADGGGLKVMTETAQNLGKGAFRAIVTGGTRRGGTGIVDAEVDKALEILESIEDGTAESALLGGKPLGSYPSVGVVAYTRDQVAEIRKQTMGRFLKLDLIVGTPEEMQGNERDVILLTFGLGEGTRYAKAHYENANRFNVASSRARLFTVAILGVEPRTSERLRRYLNLDNATRGAFSFPAIRLEHVDGEGKRLLAGALERYAQQRTKSLGSAGVSLHAAVNACGQTAMDFVLINHVDGRGLHVEIDGAPGYPQAKHYPALQRERVGVLSRAGYGVVHLRHADLYEAGWLKAGKAWEDFQAALAADLDRLLLKP